MKIDLKIPIPVLGLTNRFQSFVHYTKQCHKLNKLEKV